MGARNFQQLKLGMFRKRDLSVGHSFKIGLSYVLEMRLLVAPRDGSKAGANNVIVSRFILHESRLGCRAKGMGTNNLSGHGLISKISSHQDYKAK